MNKKILTISLVAVAAITASVATALAFKKESFNNLYSVEATEQTIVFQGSDMTVKSYDSSDYQTQLSFHKAEAFEASDGVKYDLDSFDYNENDYRYRCGLVGNENGYHFKENNKIASFTSEGWEIFTVSFRVLKRANLDLSSSVIDFTIGGVYDNSKFELYDSDSDELYNYYIASRDFYSDYGKTVTIDDVKIVINC